MGLYPPDDPYVIQTVLFGIPLLVRWYGLLIVCGAMLGTWLAARRAKQRGYNPNLPWNQLSLGFILGVVCARIYYVLFEWSYYNGNIVQIVNITTGGLAIHGAIIGALLSVVIYTRLIGLPFWQWLDIHVPGFLIAQSIGRWGNFFNQEAYGDPTTMGFGVRIDPMHRVQPYANLYTYPPDTLFHATFLYESVWTMLAALSLLLLDYRHGAYAPKAQRWLCHGDLFFLYCIIYSVARFWIEGLRVDSLYVESLRVAQIASIVLMLLGIGAMAINHKYVGRCRNDE